MNQKVQGLDILYPSHEPRKTFQTLIIPASKQEHEHLHVQQMTTITHKNFTYIHPIKMIQHYIPYNLDYLNLTQTVSSFDVINNKFIIINYSISFNQILGVILQEQHLSIPQLNLPNLWNMVSNSIKGNPIFIFII